MLETFTLEAVLKWLLISGGIAVLLERIPAWAEWKSPAKAAIVFAINAIAAFAFPNIVAYIPADLMTQTLDKLIIAGFMAAASFVIHNVDVWLDAHKMSAQAKAGYDMVDFLSNTEAGEIVEGAE